VLAELIATEGVREIAITRGRVVIMALHGGVERATFPIAEAIAAETGASLYAVVQPEDFFWHVPSTEFDPAKSEALATVVDHADLAVSLHGFGRRGLEDAVLLGGSHRPLAAALGAAMRAADVRAIDELHVIPPGLRGVHPANPVNLPQHGGVQIEMSASVRRPPHRERIVETVSEVVTAWLDETTE
jgi:phage replication-related protein YjqB (UPF0714/DUF867 family)